MKIFFILLIFFSNYLAAELPDLGSTSLLDLSSADEKILGSQIYNSIIKSEVILDDPEATDYLKEKLKTIIQSGIKKNLITGSTISLVQQFDIFLINDPMLNAFALPGAKIGVHTGLFFDVGSEGELMSVLSHELAHITQRHIARIFGKRKESSAIVMASAILAAMAASSSNGDAAIGLMTLGQGAAVQKDLIFSREAEHEADRVGLKFLIAGGFEASKMVNMLESLNSSNLRSGQSPSWFSSHPMNFERIAEIKSRVSLESQNSGQSNSTKSELFRWIRARLDTGKDFISTDDPTKKFIPKELLIEPNKLEKLYGFFWNSLRKKNYELAGNVILKLKKEVKFSTIRKDLEPMLALAEASLENEAKRYSNSVKIIKNSFPLKANHPSHRALLRLLLKNHMESGSLLLADETARKILETWPKDFSVWAQRALIAEELGIRAKAHIYTAERYAAMNEWYLAIEQLNIAKTHNELDFISLSKIDARLKELKMIYNSNLQFSSRR